VAATNKKRYRPGRKLVIFILGIVVLFGLTVLSGTNWKPELGLDLQGGTRITLIAKGNPTAESLEEARSIIDQRVNGSGVAEAEVVRQGDRFIVVEIPGATRRDLIETVKRQAQLRFRLVAGQPMGPGQQPGEQPSEQPSEQPNGKSSPSNAPSPSGDATQGDNQGNNRPAPGFDVREQMPAADPSPSGSPSAKPGTGKGSEPASPSPSPTGKGKPGKPTLDEALQFAANPPQQWVTRQAQFECPKPGAATNVVDDPNKPLVTCDEEGNRFLLTPAVIEGTELSDASYGTPQQGVGFVVTLDLKGGTPTQTFGQVSRALFNNGGQFAIVLDGTVISYAGFNEPILDGNAQISGDFSEEEAKSLATSLKFGALPVSFQEDPSTETIGPSLAGNQLQAGLYAGAFGLALVMIYCLIYYRGLGIVVLASLAVAAVITYLMVLLLSEAAGFTLTLPGIAGLIIGVGVTADSFIIFFERIRDEMREGKSMRVAVETGWARARKTRVAANVVSLLSATVLYFFATGVVKGFGFALGLSTAIDLAVLFWFTKHLVSWLAKFRFFNGGGALSGLSAGTLGIDEVPQGGRA
jgi:preprotein translocase subunit SecD